MLFVLKYVFSPVGHSLSKIWNVTGRFTCFSLLCKLAVAETNSCSLLFFMGAAKIPFASSEYKTMMYLFPSKDVCGKRPVRSDATVPSSETFARNTQFVRATPGAQAVISTVYC